MKYQWQTSPMNSNRILEAKDGTKFYSFGSALTIPIYSFQTSKKLDKKMIIDDQMSVLAVLNSAGGEVRKNIDEWVEEEKSKMELDVESRIGEEATKNGKFILVTDMPKMVTDSSKDELIGYTTIGLAFLSKQELDNLDGGKEEK